MSAESSSASADAVAAATDEWNRVSSAMHSTSLAAQAFYEWSEYWCRNAEGVLQPAAQLILRRWIERLRAASRAEEADAMQAALTHLASDPYELAGWMPLL